MGKPRLYEKIGLVTIGYQGNSSAENRYSGIASHKKILSQMPYPGRNPSEDSCFDLSGVTGLSQLEFHPATVITIEEEVLIDE